MSGRVRAAWAGARGDQIFTRASRVIEEARTTSAGTTAAGGYWLEI